MDNGHLDPASAAAHGASPEQLRRWLGEQLGALGEDAYAERWATREEALAPAAVAAVLEQLRTTSGVVDARAGIRILIGWVAGPPAALIGAIAVRDGVGVDLAASRDVRIGLAAEGYATGLQIGSPRISVVAGHPWAGAANVGVVADEHALDELVLAGIAGWCTPIIEALEPTGRGRGPLWAQVGDSLAPIAGMLAGAEPGSDPLRWVARVERLLAVRPVPWRQRAAAVDGRCRRSADRGVPARLLLPLLPQRGASRARRRSIPTTSRASATDSPAYCGTCRLRSAEDVEARAVYWALRARAAVDSLGVERPVEVGARGLRAGDAAQRRRAPSPGRAGRSWRPRRWRAARAPTRGSPRPRRASGAARARAPGSRSPPRRPRPD